MKRFFTFICAMSMLLVLSACNREPQDIDQPVTFYYCNQTTSYGEPTAVINSEEREGTHIETLAHLVDIYMRGPISEDLKNPFPKSMRFLNVAELDNRVVVWIDQKNTDLSGISLTLACTCLGLTLLEFADAESVEYYGENDVLDGNEVIIIDRDTLQLYDETKLPIQ